MPTFNELVACNSHLCKKMLITFCNRIKVKILSYMQVRSSYASFFRYSIFYILKNSVNFKSPDIIISVWTPGGIHFWMSFESYIIWSWQKNIFLAVVTFKYLLTVLEQEYLLSLLIYSLTHSERKQTSKTD